MHIRSRVSVRFFSVAMILAPLVFSSESRGQQPVKDINTTPLQVWGGTDPSPARIGNSYYEREFLRLGGWTWFKGRTPVTGTELFRTNGTKTELVKDIYPGSDDSDPTGLTLIGGKLYFSAEDPLHGRELWVSDGTAKGTRLFGDFIPGPTSSKVYAPTGLSKGRILFIQMAQSVQGLWITDGTPAGTKQIIKSSSPSEISGIGATKDGSLAYFGYTGGVWATNGTIQGTRLVLKAKKAYLGVPLRPIGTNAMLCEVQDAALNIEIWMLQGTAKAPVRLFTIPRPSFNSGQGLPWSVEYKGKIWFTAVRDYSLGLYSTDGTPKGTMKMASWTGRRDGLRGLVTDGKTLKFIIGERRLRQSTIWISDGTKKGTKPWITFPALGAARLCLSGGKVFLRGYTAKSGNELWVSDGTKAGTFMVRDIVSGTKSSAPWFITEVSPGQVMFRADDGAERNKKEPWVSKGTAKSTQQLDLRPWSKALDTADDKVNGIMGFNGKVFFSADDGKVGPELWCSDGTAKGTRLVKDIWPGPKGGLPYSTMVPFGDKLLFVANDGEYGFEPWISDGTSQGTRMLKNIGFWKNSSNPSSFVATGKRAFFLTGMRTPWMKLWVTDGTEAGTKLVIEGLNGQFGATLLALSGGRVLLSHYNAQKPWGTALWVSDGSAKGTKLIWSPVFRAEWWWGRERELYLYKGRAFFSLDDGKSGMELWVSDGTSKGTYLFLNIASDLQGKTSSGPGKFYMRGGMLYFQAYTKARGRTLWVSDGTVKGTRHHSKLGVLDGAFSFTNVGSRYLYFSAKDARGMENLASMDLQGKVRFYSGINPIGQARPINSAYGKFAFAVEDGAIWFSAMKHGFDRQLYALREHAVASPLGEVLASTTLSATDPVQGQSATVEARTQVRNPMILIMLGLRARRPMPVTPFYLLYYDFTAFAQPVGIGFADRINIGIPIPLDKSLTGTKAILQAWSLDTRRFPQGLELSNAVHWYVGR